MTVSTFAINNLTVTQNHGNTTITAENMFRGGTHSTYVAQVLAIGKGVYTFVECQFDNEQTDAAYDGNPVHGTFPTLQAAAQAAFDFVVEMVTKLENDFAAGYPANNMLNDELCALEAFADAANIILHTTIAEQADLQNEANEIADAIIENSDFATYTKGGKYFADNARTIVYLFKPENANTELEYEALQAGAAFDNSAPLPSFNKQYDLSGDIYELNEVIDEIAVEQADDLAAIDDEITRLKARLLSLGSTRQDIVEEYTHWHCKAQERLNELEYDEAYHSDEAQADLRQSIWFATGQDIM